MNAGKEFVKEAYRAIFQKDYQRAIDLFRKAIKRDSQNPSYYYKLSVTYARNNELDAAITAIRQALELCPEQPVYIQHLQHLQGRCLAKEALHKVKSGESADAVIPLLQQSIELDPISSQPRLLYAWLLHQQGMKEEAMAALQEVLSLDPWHRDAIAFLKEWTTQEHE